MDNLGHEISNSDIKFISGENPLTWSDMDSFLANTKHENLLPASDCLQNDISFNLEPNIFPFELLPDSTVNRVTPLIPVSTSSMPSKETYPGPCDFDVEFSKTEGDRAKWEFSDSLNKLYVMMGGKVPVKFRWNQNEFGLSVRALPVFLAQDHFAEAVRRCPSHASTLEMSNKDFPEVDHVIRCHTSNAVYERNIESNRLSVVAPLDCPQPGSNWSTIVYSFMCKNSCSLGMNRRATAVIFTLERPNGEVIGRKLINIRICSCPRRDMGKDENDLAKKADNGEGIKEPENSEMSDEGSVKVREVRVRKPVKRLTNLPCFIIRTQESNFKRFAKVIIEMIGMSANKGALTPEDELTIQDCAKYLN